MLIRFQSFKDVFYRPGGLPCETFPSQNFKWQKRVSSFLGPHDFVRKCEAPRSAWKGFFYKCRENKDQHTQCFHELSSSLVEVAVMTQRINIFSLVNISSITKTSNVVRLTCMFGEAKVEQLKPRRSLYKMINKKKLIEPRALNKTVEDFKQNRCCKHA